MYAVKTLLISRLCYLLTVVVVDDMHSLLYLFMFIQRFHLCLYCTDYYDTALSHSVFVVFK